MVVTVVPLLLLSATTSAANINVGAIRWDAWYGKPGQPIWGNKYTGIVGKTVTSDMADPKFHYRLPFFATVTGNNTKNVSVTCDGNSTEGLCICMHVSSRYRYFKLALHKHLINRPLCSHGSREQICVRLRHLFLGFLPIPNRWTFINFAVIKIR